MCPYPATTHSITNWYWTIINTCKTFIKRARARCKYNFITIYDQIQSMWNSTTPSLNTPTEITYFLQMEFASVWKPETWFVKNNTFQRFKRTFAVIKTLTVRRSCFLQNCNTSLAKFHKYDLIWFTYYVLPLNTLRVFLL